MDNSKIQDRYGGRKYTIVHCDGALETLRIALSRVTAAKRRSLINRLVSQIERLASGEPMSKDRFPAEGVLPKLNGVSSGRFHALKYLPIRGYCWKSKQNPSIWYISHYVYKDQNKLSSRDESKVATNWMRIEGVDNDS